MNNEAEKLAWKLQADAGAPLTAEHRIIMTASCGTA